jgi:uncharacterized protein
VVRPITSSDFDGLLALNNAHAQETSLLDRDKFERMIAAAFCCRTTARTDALLIAFDQSSVYEGGHFKWFRDRYNRFVYVDRVIVAAAARGKGLARALYEDLFTAARSAGLDFVTCEVNSVPPNPGSDAFHAALGFSEVGQGSPAPGKVVRYLLRTLA